MAAALGVVAALALAGPSSSGAPRFPSIAPASASAVPPAPAPDAASRRQETALDAARASVPLPRVPDTSTTTLPRASRSAARSRLVGDALWAALARCESSGSAEARSADGRYSGAFQFSDATWHSLGYEGSAADHPFAVQLEGAKRLQARSGWSQWP